MNFPDLTRFFHIRNLIFSFFQKPKQKKIGIYIIAGLCGFLTVLFIFIFILLGPFSDFFWKMPSMLGFTGEKHYLILIENNSERRPTGGFITAYGELSTFLGFSHLEFHDSYDMNAPKAQITPPYPLNELLKDDNFYKGWVFRDANWSPDFPTSATAIESLYLEGQERVSRLDGIISLDFSVIEKLLHLVGSVRVGKEVITAENFFHLSQFYSKNIDLHSVTALGNRKNLMKDLIPAIIHKLVFSPSRYGEIVASIKNLYDTQHIQMFFHKDSWQSIVTKNRWDGVFSPSAQDFVHVNVANIGGRKADRYIQPKYSYSVLFDRDGQGHVTLDLSFFHAGTQGLYSDFYQSYVRVYLPKEISNIKKWGDNRSEFRLEEDLGVESIGALLHIWPGETQSLHFSYDLPADVMPLEYQFEAIPMAGNFGEEWDITARYANNDNFWKSNDFLVRENLASFHGILHQDRIFKAQILDDITPPVIISQKFIDPSTIELQFSEPLDEKTFHPENITLIDKNVKHPEVTDTPSILSISQDVNKQRIYIKVNGVTWQYEEQFSLVLQGLKDLAGNSTEPERKEITLVQR